MGGLGFRVEPVGLSNPRDPMGISGSTEIAEVLLLSRLIPAPNIKPPPPRPPEMA